MKFSFRMNEILMDSKWWPILQIQAEILWLQEMEQVQLGQLAARQLGAAGPSDKNKIFNLICIQIIGKNATFAS